MRIHGVTLYLRDSGELTPGKKSLGEISKLYPSIPKLDVPQGYIKNMALYKKEYFEEFKEYAMRDPIIPLHHALHIMEAALKETGKYYIPITLSSLAQDLISRKLGPSFQLPTKNKKYNVRDLARLFTPKGIELSGGLADYLTPFIASFRGGRNESYLYGRVPGPLYDYDLPNAYATGLSLAAMPDYLAIEPISKMDQKTFEESYKDRLVTSYTALKIKFTFPEETMYPNLGVRLDDASIIFPLTGETYCTGIEMFYALSLGCKVEILGGYFIPFTKKKKEGEEGGVVVGNKKSGGGGEGEGEGEKIVQKAETENLIKENIAIIEAILVTNTKNVEGMRNQREKTSFPISSQSLAVDNGVPNELIESMISVELDGTYDKDEAVIPVQKIRADDLKQGGNPEPFNDRHGFEATEFFNLMENLISRRNNHKKGTFQNQFYKFLSNSGIGQMSRGIGQKKTYDHITNDTVVIMGGQLTNPLVAG